MVFKIKQKKAEVMRTPGQITRKNCKKKYSGMVILIVLIIQIILSNPLIFNLFDNQSDHTQENAKSKLNSSSGHPISADDFKYYKVIVIDHNLVQSSKNLYNYPLLISIFDTDLHVDVQPDGDDIAFASNDTWLFHEIELFNQDYNGTHAQLIAWVSIPFISPTRDTVIRMYYGCSFMKTQENPSKVWDENYSAIWHMSEAVADGTLDGIKDSIVWPEMLFGVIV